ncbi:MAG: succinate dehydrogenase cytochrome b subunit [Verrucomicrobia bacterium]|nr:succinate dehydrogenase cytochrome b subunit [Verrucomicrobiota bacterium]
MNLWTQVWRSSLGKKYVMAVSGFVLLLFVVGHLAGNLQIFLPPHYLNHYAAFLQSNLEVIWPVRLVLLALLVLHIVAAVQLEVENKAARPTSYAQKEPGAASFASRSMLLSGLMIGAFVVYHLLHYTAVVQAVNFTGVDFAKLVDPATGHRDVYAMTVYGFSKLPVSAFYLLAMGLLCLHLSHGTQSMFQSLGWKNSYYSPLIAKAAWVLAVVLFLGYSSIPVGVLLGHGQDYLKQIESKVAVTQFPAGKEIK